MVFRDYATRWLEHQQQRLRPRTWNNYRQLVRDHLVPVIGDVRVDSLRPGHVELVLNEARASGLSPRTTTMVRAVLSASMRQAVAWGLATSNPTQAVRPPRSERPRLAVPTSEELMRLLAEAKGSQWAAPILLAVATGARRSEVLAIRWSDIDLDRRRLRITRGLQRVDGQLVWTDPKTNRARREVGLPAFAVDGLHQWRRTQAARRLALGPAWQDLDLVADRGDGAPVPPDSFSQAFRRLARQAGLPPKSRLHDVRHAVATAMLERGVHPAIASASLGHSSPAFTMSTYQHVIDGMADQAAAALDAALGGA
jgi:integrase